MAWIKLTPVYGPVGYFNTDLIAYILEPPADEAERGAGAGISFSDNTRNVTPVRESLQSIMNLIELQGAF